MEHQLWARHCTGLQSEEQDAGPGALSESKGKLHGLTG